MTVASKAKKAERTEAQRQQARINGAKSRGPKTDEGKAISRRNAVRHGYRSESIVSAVDLPRYETLRDALLRDLPREAREIDAILAGNIASAVIRKDALRAAPPRADEPRRHRNRKSRRAESRRHGQGTASRPTAPPLFGPNRPGTGAPGGPSPAPRKKRGQVPFSFR